MSYNSPSPRASPIPARRTNNTGNSNNGGESVYSASNLSTSNSVNLADGNLTETRKRQGKRDEAIRRKIESELSRKRPTNKNNTSSRRPGSAQPPRPKQGTVSALRPLPALTVPHSISVADASQLCAAKRTDCVLVVDEEEHLCGIFTAKDLAFRVVADGLDPRTTPVSAIMTPNPMVTRDSTSATDALQTMVTRGFRHLPVCNEDGDVVGLLDITKVFHESLEKLERAYGSSQKLYNALEGVQSEWGPSGAGGASANPAASGLMAYVEALREKMSFPDLGSILDARTAPATVTIKTTVREAAKLMRERRTTAVCVMENDGRKIAGIFTSKDVVLRVIAAGLDAKSCSVVRVMTPHPDVGLPTLSIQDALRKMHDGHYLNLPVVDDEGSLVGIVDVLKLTYATLEQVNSIGAENGEANASGGPLWGKFFGGLGAAEEDNESIFSGGDTSELPLSPSVLNNIDATGSEVFPNDSASVIYDDERAYSDVGGGNPVRRAVPASSVGAMAVPPPTVDDGTYLFKFVAPGGTTHRFQARCDSFEFITDIIAGKLVADPFFTRASASTPTTAIVSEGDTLLAPVVLDPRDFQLYYQDDDGDLVLITADQDIKDAVAVARVQGKDRVVVNVRGGMAWEEEIERRGAKKAAATIPVLAPVAAPAIVSRASDLIPVGEEDEAEAVELEKVKSKSSSKAKEEELVFGFLKKDQLLPASVAFLAIAIVGVFAVSRTTSNR